MSPEVQKIICQALREANTHKTSAGLAGISLTTLQNWIARGRAGDPKYVEFLREFDKAHDDATAELVSYVKAAGRDTWQAAKWMLEVRDAQYRVPKDVVITTDHNDSTTDRRGEICAELARRGESLTREQLRWAAAWVSAHE